MRKFLSILLVLAMCFSLICVSNAEGEMNIVVGKTELEYGAEEAVVEISIPNNPGIAVIGFNVNYDDEALTLESAELVDIFKGELENNLEAFPFVFNVYSGSSNKTESGTLVKLTFSVNDNCVPGTYEITVDRVEAINIAEDSVPYAVTNGYVKIKALEMTGITFEDASYTYDGTEKEILVSGTLPEGAEVSYENNKATKAGTYEAKATVTAPGYEDLELDATLEIKSVELEIEGFGAENKTYDGTTDATLIEGELQGVVEGDDVEAVYPEKGAFASKDASTKAIEVAYDEITLTGEDAENYTLKQPGKISAKIAKAPLTVTADDITIRKGEEIPALTYEIESGELFGDDVLEGALATRAKNTVVGDYAITKGTLKASSNYTLTVVEGTLSVVDKAVQEITVATLTEKTYGDSSFVLEVTAGNEELGAVTYTSSNTDVAEIAADGTITIKAAGETDITVSRAGNADFADFAKVQTLTVNKVEITVNVTEGQSKRVGTDDPAEFTYTHEGTLVGEDAFTGVLTREEGEEIGFYDITIGTLALNDNYEITFNGAKFEITAKTHQEITLAEIPALTYGDAAYTITVTKDATANLEAYTYESDNTDVLTITDGVITVVGAGEATVTVTEPGNDEYAEAKASQKVTVNKKEITVDSVDVTTKTTVLSGIVGEDAIALDFSKIIIEIGEAIDETSTSATVKNFVLTGEKAINYVVTTESVNVTMAKESLKTVTVTVENGTATGAGTYLTGSEVTLTITPANRYKFLGWYKGEELVSAEAVYTFTINEDTNLNAVLEKRKAGGTTSGSVSLCRINFDTDGGETIFARNVEYGEKLGFVAAAVKEGYVFEGWFLDEDFETAYAEDMKITGDITLYAKWSKEGEDKGNGNKEIILTVGDKEASVFGEEKANDVAPIIKNDRTMLPARFVAEALGAKVSWNEEKREVTIEAEGIKIVITIDSDKAFINEEEVTLDSPAFIENSRTYTPIRFVAEALGASVSWDEETQKVTILVK
ncbi:MAG: InlB B-repeat-containing protein [Clostridia bacterium]|nr:InlB B-repeat-containing protein [Clostridia bacterium]